SVVLGKVLVENLGVTLTHEHLKIDFDKFYTPPPAHLSSYFGHEINIKNVGYVKQYPYSSRPNLHLFGGDVEEAIAQELAQFKKFGGGTIVENTSHGLSRDPALYVRLSKQTGVHIVVGTGHYVADVQDASVLNSSVQKLYNTIKKDFEEGCTECESVKCGFIGEVGSGWPIKEFEKRCIKAAGEAQADLGCAVSFHPGRHPGAPSEIIRLYTEAGGALDKAVMSHLDRTLVTDEQLLDFASLGCYCQFDLFGTECSHYQLNPIQDMLSDAQRIDKIIKLIDDGRLAKITISHDIHTRHRLVNFGGHGYSHILNNVVPKMVIKQMEKSAIDTIMVENPLAWLSCKKL
ncbi:hypothetical protein AAG570_014078, partial [Ranatra chinensis]